MTDPADLVRPDAGQPAHIIHLVDAESYEDWLGAQPERVRAALEAQGFKATPFARAILPGDNGQDWAAVGCVKTVGKLGSWCLARLAEVLPEGNYRLANATEPGSAILGWMTAHYKFERCKEKPPPPGRAHSLTPQPAAIEPAARLRGGSRWCATWSHTPTADMGPDEIERRA